MESNYDKYRMIAALVNALENEYGERFDEMLAEYKFMYGVYSELREAGWDRDLDGCWRYFGTLSKDESEYVATVVKNLTRVP